MHAKTYICLHCLKAAKDKFSCCGFNTYYLGTKVRTPKITSSKQEWKSFIDMFLTGSNNNISIGQLKKIISLRSKYKLSTNDQEIKLQKISTEHEEKFGILDIKRHEILANIPIYKLEKTIRAVDYFTKHHSIAEDNLEYTKEYYIVPLHATYSRSEYIFPTDSSKFNILKVRARKSSKSSRKVDLVLKTDNSSEIINNNENHGYYLSNRYSYKQTYLIFKDKITAAAFRQEYLTAILPILKEHNASYIDTIMDHINIDFDRVLKKAPQLLV